MGAEYWTRKLPPVKVAPSMIESDLAHLADQVAALESLGIDMFHIDVADAHFAPNLMLSPRFVEVMRGLTRGHLNVHLMMTDPGEYAPRFIKAGADLVFFHIEAVEAPRAVIEIIRSAGCSPAVALKPATPPDQLKACIADVDAVMAMTVNPGFSGQSFMEEACWKIPAIRAMKPELDIYVDGGVSAETTGTVVRYGANILVAGSALFRPGVDTARAIEGIRRAAREAVAGRE